MLDTYDAPAPYDEPFSYDGGAIAFGGWFYPPTVQDEPPYLPDSKPMQIQLWRHYAPGIRGVNVFLLSNGTYVQDTATEGHPSTVIPYPINFNYPGAPFVSITNWDSTVQEEYQNPYVVKQYFGGHYNVISEEEADALTAGGYGENIVDELPFAYTGPIYPDPPQIP